MTAQSIWKVVVLIALIAIPGTLLLLPLYLAHRKLRQRGLVPVPRSLNGPEGGLPLLALAPVGRGRSRAPTHRV
jgi:hypothetical protein